MCIDPYKILQEITNIGPFVPLVTYLIYKESNEPEQY